MITMRQLRIPALLSAVGACALLAALAAGPGSGATTYATSPTDAGAINPQAIPLGDGYYGSTPKVGYVDSCQTSFSADAGGAQNVGPWINQSAKTWDESTKLSVSGSVSWPSASYSATTSSDKRVITFNDLPTDHTTGTFPVASSDPAAAYDKNPNKIEAHNYTWNLPLDPTAADKPSCVGMGAIGVLDDGVILYNALDGEGRDAGAHEVLDACGGHPDQSDTYHHHDVPPCILDKIPNGTTQLVGYALDGYGIYVTKDANGNLPTNTDLDACHGTTSAVPWDGKTVTMYHYVATLEYPYTVGCYHGTAISVSNGSAQQGGQQGNGGQGPQGGKGGGSQSQQGGQQGGKGGKNKNHKKNGKDNGQGQGPQGGQGQGQGQGSGSQGKQGSAPPSGGQTPKSGSGQGQGQGPSGGSQGGQGQGGQGQGQGPPPAQGGQGQGGRGQGGQGQGGQGQGGQGQGGQGGGGQGGGPPPNNN
jgi:YHYH protein